MAYLRAGPARVGRYCTTWVRRRAYSAPLIDLLSPPIALFDSFAGKGLLNEMAFRFLFAL